MNSFKDRFKTMTKEEKDSVRLLEDLNVLLSYYIKNLVNDEDKMTVNILNRNYNIVSVLKNTDKPYFQKLKTELKDEIEKLGFVVDEDDEIYCDPQNETKLHIDALEIPDLIVDTILGKEMDYESDF